MSEKTEDALAACLKRSSVGGFRFTRGARVGSHVVDFVCAEARLVVELDCAPLRTPQGRAAHRARLRAIERRGYRVLRFWADHVDAAPRSVERLVGDALRAHRAAAASAAAPLAA